MKNLFLLALGISTSLTLMATKASAEDLLGVVYNGDGFKVQFADSCLTKNDVKVAVMESFPVQLVFRADHKTSPCPVSPNGSQISYKYSEFGQGAGAKFIIRNTVKPGVMNAN